MPLVRFGFRTMQFVDTDALPIVAGAALIGPLAAFGRYRRIAVISALVYGGALLIFVTKFQDKLGTMQNELKDNPFAGLIYGLVGLIDVGGNHDLRPSSAVLWYLCSPNAAASAASLLAWRYGFLVTLCRAALHSAAIRKDWGASLSPDKVVCVAADF